MTGLEGLVQNSNDAYNNLMGADSIAKRQNQAALMQQRGIMAGYKDQQFNVNKLDPYNSQAQAAQGLMGAGLQNFMGALDSAGSIAGASTIGDGTGVDNGSGVGSFIRGKRAKKLIDNTNFYDTQNVVDNGEDNPPPIY